jgi:hypothetical protein
MSAEGGIGSISGDVGNVFTDAQGPITIHNYPEHHRRPRDPWVLNANLLTWTEERFVPPDGYSSAFEKVRDSGLAVIHGAPGTGRRTAALMLLRGTEATGFRELSNRPAEENEPLNATAVERGDRLLLDLSETPDDDVDGLRNELDSLCAIVQQAKARLVVVISPNHRALLAPLHPWLVGIGRPDGRQVFGRHLTAEEIHPKSADLTAPQLDRYLALESMQSISELAALVRDARDAQPDLEFAAWLAAAFVATTEQSAAVAKQVKDHPDSPYRSLLATTAFFERTSPDAVFVAEQELQRALAVPEDERHVLARADLAERLADIDVSVDGERHVRFGKLAYDAAVREHFWHNFPGLRETFRDWIGTTARLRVLSEEELERLVDRFAEQCLATGQHQHLFTLTKFWTVRGHAVSPAARQALACGLRDPGVAWEFRREIYWWSRDYSLRPELAHVLISVCAEEITATKPEQALVRLNHLARNHDEGVARIAKDALHRLADRDNRYFRKLLFRVAGHPLDHDLFLELTEPARLVEPHRGARPLIDHRDVRAALTEGWATVLAGGPHHQLTRPVAAWLHDNRLLSLLIDACGTRADLFNTLYVITRDWVRDAADDGAHRRQVATRLQRAIDSAFGLTTEENLR